MREPIQTNARWGTANKARLSKRVIFLSVSVSLTWWYNYNCYPYFAMNPWSAARTLLAIQYSAFGLISVIVSCLCKITDRKKPERVACVWGFEPLFMYWGHALQSCCRLLIHFPITLIIALTFQPVFRNELMKSFDLRSTLYITALHASYWHARHCGMYNAVIVWKRYAHLGVKWEIINAISVQVPDIKFVMLLVLATEFLVPYPGRQIARSPRLIFLDLSVWICCMSTCWRLEFWPYF